jgi:hypothetical protein
VVAHYPTHVLGKTQSVGNLCQHAADGLALYGQRFLQDTEQTIFCCARNEQMCTFVLLLSAALHCLVGDGNTTTAALHLKDLAASLSTTQPTNVALHLTVLAPIARLACGDIALLSQTKQLLGRLQKALPRPDTELALELARQQILSGELQVCFSPVASAQPPLFSLNSPHQLTCALVTTEPTLHQRAAYPQRTWHYPCASKRSQQDMRCNSGSAPLQAALTTLHAERGITNSNMVGLMTAEAEVMLGRTADAASTLEIYASTLDSSSEAAYGAYVAALLATVTEVQPEAAVDKVEAAVQAHLDTLHVRATGLSSPQQLLNFFRTVCWG